MSVSALNPLPMQAVNGRPIRPEECNDEVPKFVFDIMNELIQLHMYKNKSTVYLKEFKREIMKVHSRYIPNKWFLKMIKFYQESGWNVELFKEIKGDVLSLLGDEDEAPLFKSELYVIFSIPKSN